MVRHMITIQEEFISLSFCTRNLKYNVFNRFLAQTFNFY